MTRLNAVLRAKSDGRLKVAECAVRIALEAISGSQRVMDILLVGSHLVGLVKILESLVKVPAIQRRHSACVIAFRGLGALFVVPLALTISQMNFRPVSNLPDRTCGDLLKKRSSFFEVPSLEIFYCRPKIFQRICAIGVQRLRSRLGNTFYAGLGAPMHCTA